MQTRFENGRYRDCKWCGGRGCLACPAEAEKEYNRQFPDGPKPIATFKTADFDEEGFVALMKSLLGPEAIMAAKAAAEKEAEKIISENPAVAQIAGVTSEQAKQALATGLAGDIIHQNIVKAGLEAGAK